MSCLQNDVILERLYEEHEEIYRDLLGLDKDEELTTFDLDFIEKTVLNAFERMGA